MLRFCHSPRIKWTQHIFRRATACRIYAFHRPIFEEKKNGSLKYFNEKGKEKQTKKFFLAFIYFNSLTPAIISSSPSNNYMYTKRKRQTKKKKYQTFFAFFVYMFLHFHSLNKQKEYIYCKWKSACGKATKKRTKTQCVSQGTTQKKGEGKITRTSESGTKGQWRKSFDGRLESL